MVRNRLLLGIVLLLTMLFFSLQTAYADEVIFTEDFEQEPSKWYPSNGVWEIGVPSSGPGAPHGGLKCAGTVLNGNYPAYTDSRLIYSLPYLPDLELPEVSGDEEIHLRFWHWFSYSSYDYGYIQIQVQDGSDWKDVPGAITVSGVYAVWTLRDVDLTPYAGQTVKIGFYHTANRDSVGRPSESTGWYIDDIEVVKKVPKFTGDFEDGWGDWTADNCVWDVGTSVVVPPSVHEGSQCTGTVIDGNYPGYRDSRLISPFIWLDPVTGDEEIHLRFWHWFSYSSYDYGYVQIQIQDVDTGKWSSWETISTTIQQTSAVWTPMDIDLTTYADQKVRVAFYHTANRDSVGRPSESTGWYIDDIEVVKKAPKFTVDFEGGWKHWSADNGIWEVGEPTSGPGCAHRGDQCAGTVMGGNYAGYTDSRLVSPPIWLPLECCEVLYMCYWQWWSYSSYDYGYLQISIQDEGTGGWSDWVTLPGTTVEGSSPVWTRRCVELTAYEGQTVKIAFCHTANRDSVGRPSESTGWYIDNIHFPGISPVIDSISFARYIPPLLCSTSTITLTAHDPCEGNLTYNWDAPDGGEIIGTGAEVEFVPPEEPEPPVKPYRVWVSVTSDATHISSFLKVIKIYTKVLNDHDHDRDIDGSDLADFAADYDSEVDDLARFAEEFGMVACQ